MLCTVSGGVLLFQRLADEIPEGETKSIDQIRPLALRHPDDLARPIAPAWLAHAATDITSLGGVTVLTLATQLTVLYPLAVRRRSRGLFVFLATGERLMDVKCRFHRGNRQDRWLRSNDPSLKGPENDAAPHVGAP